MCLDARELNKNIEDDQEFPPMIEELMQKFYGCEFWSKIDLTQGYFQIELSVESRPYTAFLFGSGLYQFVQVPFGVKAAGSGFIRALSIALEGDIEKYRYEVEFEKAELREPEERRLSINNTLYEKMSSYVDDITIATKTFREHI